MHKAVVQLMTPCFEGKCPGLFAIMLKLVRYCFLLGGLSPSNVMCPAFLFLTNEVC